MGHYSVLWSMVSHSTIVIKVLKFQKQIFLFSFEPKNEQNYFVNSALASIMSQTKKNEGTSLFQLGVFNTIEALFFI